MDPNSPPDPKAEFVPTLFPDFLQDIISFSAHVFPMFKSVGAFEYLHRFDVRKFPNSLNLTSEMNMGLGH